MFIRKYRNKKITIDGHTFDSLAEGSYYKELLLKQSAGLLKLIELQPKVYLTKARILYKPDFLIEENGKKIWIDVKGMKTASFNLKRRLWVYYGPGPLRIVRVFGRDFRELKDIEVK